MAGSDPDRDKNSLMSNDLQGRGQTLFKKGLTPLQDDRPMSRSRPVVYQYRKAVGRRSRCRVHHDMSLWGTLSTSFSEEPTDAGSFCSARIWRIFDTAWRMPAIGMSAGCMRTF